MFGLFKKNMDSLELCVIFIKVVTPIIENQKNELSKIGFVEEKVIKFIQQSNKKISDEQLITIKYASQILGLNVELQNKILQLHHSTIDETKNNFMEVWDDFKSFGCFS